MTEQAIQKKIITMLEQDYNAYVVKVVVSSKSGVPDLLCCVPIKSSHIFVGIEIKRPESKSNVSKLQEYNLKRITQANGLSFVSWGVDHCRGVLNEYIRTHNMG